MRYRVTEEATVADGRFTREQQHHGGTGTDPGATLAADQHADQQRDGPEEQQAGGDHDDRPVAEEGEYHGIERHQRQEPVVLGVAPHGDEVQTVAMHAVPEQDRVGDVGIGTPQVKDEFQALEQAEGDAEPDRRAQDGWDSAGFDAR